MTDLTPRQLNRLTKICDKHQDSGLHAIAGMTRIEMDRDDYQDEQHPKFAVHCIVAIAALLLAGSGIGLTWCIAVFPAHALIAGLLICIGLFAVWLFTAVEERL